jgi:hypothetical protein
MSTEQVIIGLLTVLVAGLGYWAVRLESRVDELKRDMATMAVLQAENYVRRDDCRQTHNEVRDGLSRIDAKLDRIIEKGISND